MRHAVLLLMTALLLSPAQAFAQQGQPAQPTVTATAAAPATPDNTSATRGSLPTDKKVAPPEPTNAQLAEANAVREDCTRGDMKDIYDCDCLALGVLQLRAQETILNDIPKDVGLLRDKARLSCANTTIIAGRAYEHCISWAPKRMATYETFCDCYANDYAKRFGKNPAQSSLQQRAQFKASMMACNSGQAVLERLDRQREVERLQKDGIYEKLFPSAKGVVPGPRKPPPPTGRPETPSQRLGKQLYPAESE